MIDEPQTKSQSGSGRSERPTRPWAAADEGSSAAVTAALSERPAEGRGEPRPAAASGEAPHGLTVSSAICVAELSSSTSKTPSRSAGKSNLTVPPASTSSPMS